MPSATILGHMVDSMGTYPCVEGEGQHEKEYPKADVTAVRSFMGMTNEVLTLHSLNRKGVKMVTNNVRLMIPHGHPTL